MSERQIVCEDLGAAIDDWRRQGFRIDLIYPADDPHVALLSRGGDAVRLARPGAAPLSGGLPGFEPQFVLTRSDAAAAPGRAGMLYRDLIPNRLGGRYIASHILILEGGEVGDWVHYHRIALQLIAVRRGWVRVVYEDQGDPFVMNEGDLVLQPPGIRHRVLESSPGLEVVEITAPALHETLADHGLSLPNGPASDRIFDGQRFLRHVAAETAWTAFLEGEAQETGLQQASGGLAQARIIRAGGQGSIHVPPSGGELVFGFVLEGRATLDHREPFDLAPADAFVVSPDDHWTLGNMSDDFRLLHVTTGRLDAAAQCPL